MTKYEFITELMELFDQLDALKRDNEDLKNALNARIGEDVNSITGHIEREDDFATYDYFALKKGRDQIFDDSTYSWRQCEAWRGNTGDIEVTRFDDWARKKIHKVPDYMSKKAFVEYFSVELREAYEKEKAEAIERLKAEEAEDEEGGDDE